MNEMNVRFRENIIITNYITIIEAKEVYEEDGENKTDIIRLPIGRDITIKFDLKKGTTSVSFRFENIVVWPYHFINKVGKIRKGNIKKGVSIYDFMKSNNPISYYGIKEKGQINPINKEVIDINVSKKEVIDAIKVDNTRLYNELISTMED